MRYKDLNKNQKDKPEGKIFIPVKTKWNKLNYTYKIQL